MIWLTFVSLIASACSALVLVPVVRFVALRFNIVDNPDAERKLHAKPIALCGGVAVLLSLLSGFAITIWYDRTIGNFDLGDVSMRWYSLVLCASAMLMVGLIDDVWAMRGRQKLLLQMLIITVLVGSGTVVDKIGVGAFELHLGSLALPVTVLWLLVCVNALNLIDGADGVATTAGCFISLGLAALCLEHGEPLSCILAFALAGSLCGFLIFNKPPASIFLGDAGSMVIGLLVGVLSVWGSVKGSTLLASAPIAVLAIPLFDSAAAIARRWLTGRSIYTTDRAHLHHLLQKKYGDYGMLGIVALLCALTTTLAVLSCHYQMPWLALLGIVLSGSFLVLTRSFGHAECRLVMIKAGDMTRSFFVTPNPNLASENSSCVKLQGDGKWDQVWEPLVEFAKSHDLAKICIDLNLAWLHEGYHATWSAMRLPDRTEQVQVRWPLVVRAGQSSQPVNIGTLLVVARADSPRVHDRIAELSLTLADLCPQLQKVIDDLEQERSGNAPAKPQDAVVSTFPKRDSKREATALASRG
ncbi:MAG: MraY family glycosyltransferase [Planctomycetota bacterium]